MLAKHRLSCSPHPAACLVHTYTTAFGVITHTQKKSVTVAFRTFRLQLQLHKKITITSPLQLLQNEWSYYYMKITRTLHIITSEFSVWAAASVTERHRRKVLEEVSWAMSRGSSSSSNRAPFSRWGGAEVESKTKNNLYLFIFFRPDRLGKQTRLYIWIRWIGTNTSVPPAGSHVNGVRFNPI